MEKVRQEKIADGEDQRWRKSEERSAGMRKGREVGKHCVFFNVLWLSGQMKDQNLGAVVSRSTVGSENV